MIQVKLSVTQKTKDLAAQDFSKQFQTHPLKSTEAEPRLSPLQNYVYFSLLTSRLENFNYFLS